VFYHSSDIPLNSVLLATNYQSSSVCPSLVGRAVSIPGVDYGRCVIQSAKSWDTGKLGPNMPDFPIWNTRHRIKLSWAENGAIYHLDSSRRTSARCLMAVCPVGRLPGWWPSPGQLLPRCLDGVLFGRWKIMARAKPRLAFIVRDLPCLLLNLQPKRYIGTCRFPATDPRNQDLLHT